MKIYICAFVSLLMSYTVVQSQVNFAEDIAPIIYKNCSSCHRPGEIGPMSLTNYDEVKNWSNTIKYVTSIKYMPPWQANPDYQNYLSENYLTEEEIARIAEWVDNGTPRGDKAQEPDFPDFPSESLLGEPDLVLEMEQAHLHKGNNKDSYYYFVLPSGLTQDKIIKAVEFRPGNTKIVHHALIFEDTEGVAKETDAMTPEYGFEGFGGFDGSNNDLTILQQKQYPGYVPGQKPIRYPIGLGQTIEAEADLVIQIHYAPSPVDEMDRSKVNIFFAEEEEEVNRFTQDRIILPFDLPGGFASFVITPNQEKTFHATWTVNKDISLLGLSPHMHLLGQDWTVYLTHTDGAITPLINIPEWDFNWQGNYYFKRFIVAEQGAKIHAFASYDNTSENPQNPNNPPQTVVWGERTQDEMLYLPIFYVDYQEGDEDIIFEEDITASTSDPEKDPRLNFINPIFPNPVKNRVNLSFNMGSGGACKIYIQDLQGREIKVLRKNEFFNTGPHQLQFDSKILTSGLYLLVIEGQDFRLTEKFIKN